MDRPAERIRKLSIVRNRGKEKRKEGKKEQEKERKKKKTKKKRRKKRTNFVIKSEKTLNMDRPAKE